MLRISTCLRMLIVVLCCGPMFSQPAFDRSSPSGSVFAAWLAAFNSGNREQAEAYVTAYDPTRTADSIVGFHQQTGDLDLVKIVTQEPFLIRFEVKEHRGTTHAFGVMHLDATTKKMTSFVLRALAPGAVPDDITLDAAERTNVVRAIGTQLNLAYVYPDLAKKMADAIAEKQKQGAYDTFTDGTLFASQLTKDLLEVSHDKHLLVNYNPTQSKVNAPGKPSPEDEARYREQMLRDNCGFTKVEILPGNIGYVKFDEFADPQVCGPIVQASIAFVAHTDGLIFDLRENGGGSPAMVSLIASYLFDEPTHLNDLYNRKGDSTEQFWTLPYVPGVRMAKVPVCVLTSKQTFSGAEEFTYDLKTQKRAVIVGETTGGGAHPSDAVKLDDHFMIVVPVGRAINPVTKTDWEGTGVEPDVFVPAADALTRAQELIKRKLAAN